MKERNRRKTKEEKRNSPAFAACLKIFFLALTMIISGPPASSAQTSVQDNSVQIEADRMDYDSVREVYHAKGKVKIIYSGAALAADDVKLDNQNNVATAQGNAFLKMEEDTVRGEKIIYNFEDKTGTAYQADAFYARNNFYVRGDKIEKTGENTYSILQPCATTCDGDNPDWQIAGREMKVTLEGYGLMKDARFLTRGFPVLYSPYLPFPAKTKRQTGLLLPYFAYSRDKDGIDIELPFFWAISPQMDATFYQRYIEKRGFKEGVEFRYYLGAKSVGLFYGDYIEDTMDVTEIKDTATRRDWQGAHRRWSYYFTHQTDFDSRFYVKTDLKKVSDQWYFKDFSAHNFYRENYADSADDHFQNVSFRGDKSLRYLESTARVYKGWSNINLTGFINYTEDFAAAENEHTFQKYPEIILAGVKQPLFRTPVFYEFTGAYDYLYSGEGERGHFVDFTPTLSLPVDIFGYLKLTPQFAFKETLWSYDEHQNDVRDKNDDRTVYNASVSLSSQLSRVFDVQGDRWEKIRHEIKPEIIYAYVPNVSTDDVPDYYLPVSAPFVFPITPLSSNSLDEQSALAWALTNTLTARLKDKDGAHSYLEFLRLKLFQAYDIHEAGRDVEENDVKREPFSDLGIELDISPSKYFSLKARSRYNFYDSWKQNNFDLRLKDERGDSMSVSYRYTVDSLEEIHYGLKAVLNRNIDATFISKYDLENSRRIENSLGFIYHKQCWSLGVDVTETDDDVRFSFRISLAGLGKTGGK